MKTKYYTTSSQFEGFYESDYYYSDMEYEYSNLMEEQKDLVKILVKLSPLGVIKG